MRQFLIIIFLFCISVFPQDFKNTRMPVLNITGEEKGNAAAVQLPIDNEVVFFNPLSVGKIYYLLTVKHCLL